MVTLCHPFAPTLASSLLPSFTVRPAPRSLLQQAYSEDEQNPGAKLSQECIQEIQGILQNMKPNDGPKQRFGQQPGAPGSGRREPTYALCTVLLRGCVGWPWLTSCAACEQW